jgi:hypothetical protein
LHLSSAILLRAGRKGRSRKTFRILVPACGNRCPTSRIWQR